jgi:hypothetical protein
MDNDVLVLAHVYRVYETPVTPETPAAAYTMVIMRGRLKDVLAARMATQFPDGKVGKLRSYGQDNYLDFCVRVPNEHGGLDTATFVVDYAPVAIGRLVEVGDAVTV